MWKKLRERINRDDGEHYQIGNHNLNTKEIVGYIFLVLALLVYLLVDKTDFQYGWLGWAFVSIGLVLVYLGTKQDESNSDT